MPGRVWLWRVRQGIPVEDSWYILESPSQHGLLNLDCVGKATGPTGSWWMKKACSKASARLEVFADQVGVLPNGCEGKQGVSGLLAVCVCVTRHQSPRDLGESGHTRGSLNHTWSLPQGHMLLIGSSHKAQLRQVNSVGVYRKGGKSQHEANLPGASMIMLWELEVAPDKAICIPC